MSATIHIAGFPVNVGGHLRQLCAWCGERLIDVDLSSVMAPMKEDGSPPDPYGTWETNALVEVDGCYSGVVEHGDTLPARACAKKVALRLVPPAESETPLSLTVNDRDHLVNIQLKTCVHFTGLQHTTCEAGVIYSELRDVSGPGMARWPCLPGHRPCATTCPKRELHTEERARAFVAGIDKAIADSCGLIVDGRCPECSEPIEPSRVVGRCKYEACGHRIGQVDATGDDE